MGLYEEDKEEGQGVWRLVRSEDTKLMRATIARRHIKRNSCGGIDLLFDVRYDHRQEKMKDALYDGCLKELNVPRDRIKFVGIETEEDKQTLAHGTPVDVVVPCFHDEAYLYRSCTGQWCVSDHDDMNTRENSGVLGITSEATSPEKAMEIWRVWQGMGQWPHDLRVSCIAATSPDGVDNLPARRGALLDKKTIEEEEDYFA
jgi:hypothetical protein